MKFLDKTGLTRLWAHIVSKLGEKISRTEIITDAKIDEICQNTIATESEVEF